MNKKNASKLWKIIQEAGDYLLGLLLTSCSDSQVKQLEKKMKKVLDLGSGFVVEFGFTS